MVCKLQDQVQDRQTGHRRRKRRLHCDTCRSLIHRSMYLEWGTYHELSTGLCELGSAVVCGCLVAPVTWAVSWWTGASMRPLDLGSSLGSGLSPRYPGLPMASVWRLAVATLALRPGHACEPPAW